MQTNHTAEHESIDTDDSLDHALGGIAVDGASMQVQNVEDGARVVVDEIRTVDGELVVGLAIRSDTISGRAYLDAEAAAEVADRLAAVAEEAGHVDE